MKKIWIMLLVIISNKMLNAQINLVPNPSFEDTVFCPYYLNQVSACLGWWNAGDSTNNLSTSDYFNSCSSNNNISPPQVSWGSQVPYGNAYCFCYTYVTFVPNGREYIQANLVQPLVVGIKYFVSFYINLAGQAGTTMGSNKMGALFTTYQFAAPHFATPQNVSTVYEDSIITDTISWHHFKKSFIADSTYEFITIGNFFDDQNTDTIMLTGITSSLSGYFIDNVCVSSDSVLCYSPTGIYEVDVSSGIDNYPNPADKFLVIKKSNLSENVLIYDLMGKVVQSVNNTIDRSYINCEDWNEGMYIIKSGNAYRKQLIIH